MRDFNDYLQDEEKQVKNEIASYFKFDTIEIDALAKLQNGDIISIYDLNGSISISLINAILNSPRIDEMLEIIYYIPEYINIDLLNDDVLKKLLKTALDYNLNLFFKKAQNSQKLFNLIIKENRFFIKNSKGKNNNILRYFNASIITNNIDIIINLLRNDNNFDKIKDVDSKFLKVLINNPKFKEYLNEIDNNQKNDFSFSGNKSRFINEFMNIVNDAIIRANDFELMQYFLSLCLEYHLSSDYPILMDNQWLKKCIANNLFDKINAFDYNAYKLEDVKVLYSKLDLEKFLKLQFVKLNIIQVLDEITIQSVEEYQKFFLYVLKNYDSYDYNFYIKLISKYNQSNLTSPDLEEKKTYLIERIKNDYGKEINDGKKASLVIDKLLTGQRKITKWCISKSDKMVDFNLKFASISSIDDWMFVAGLSENILNKVNSKHIREIIALLEEKLKSSNYSENNFSLFNLAFNIYLTLGYRRSIDLLNSNVAKSYGDISFRNLVSMFKEIDINSVLFQRDGKGYVPVINEELINLLFGENYKVKNTPIRNFIGGYEEKKAEIDMQILAIQNDSSLSEKEKKEKIEEITASFVTYKAELWIIFNRYFSRAFNEWDIISEEFLKIQNKSKLKTKLNVTQIKKIIEYVDQMRKIPDLGVEDELLMQSDVFEYVGKDFQYVINPDMAPQRAVELSRKMNGLLTKKFPDITVQEEDYTLSVFHPQDRQILTAGHKTNCCFRPNGNADNHGNDNSLLTYCATTEYGGGIVIKDKEGNVVMFSPVMRNGNVLMIHSIETANGFTPELSKIVHELLRKYAEATIAESQKVGDNIEFVMITDLHHLDSKYVVGDIPSQYRFKIFDDDSKYTDMYNNLDQNHKLIALKSGKTLEDISYGKVEYSYKYPDLKMQHYVTISMSDLMDFNLLDNLKQEIIDLTNLRTQALNDNDEKEAYNLLEQIMAKKKEYLKVYGQVLQKRKGLDLYADYKKGITTIKYINEKLGLDNLENNISEISYGTDWYIAITFDGQVLANALESGKENLIENLMKIKTIRKLEIPENLEEDAKLSI